MTASPSLDGKTSVTNPRAVPARHAASLLVVRNRPSGIEVLMGVRRPEHRFLPNQLVFPGGAVDVADQSALAASEPSPALLAALFTANSPPPRAIAMAAARELAEETGLNLGTPPRLHALRYLCRAVTPPDLPIRFNARFLTIGAEHTEGSPADSAELHSVRFYTLTELSETILLPVTRWALGRLIFWATAKVSDGEDPAPDDVFERPL